MLSDMIDSVCWAAYCVAVEHCRERTAVLRGLRRSARCDESSSLRRAAQAVRRRNGRCDGQMRRRPAGRQTRLRLPRLVEQRRPEARRFLPVVDRPEQQRPSRHRLGEQKALQLVAAHLTRIACWRWFSTPSATTFRPSAWASLMTASTTARASSLCSRSMDEAAVDLQLLGRQLAQVGQARVAGAEVVDRQVRAELAQSAEGRLRRLDVLHRHRFGDLAGQQRRVEVSLAAPRRCARPGRRGGSGPTG